MAAVDRELTEFVRDALARGISRGEIERALRDAGWPPARVRPALEAFAEADFPIPVPRARPYLSARDAFLYLVLFSTLGVSAYYLGSLLFNLIDIVFPDPAARGNWMWYAENQIRWAIAALVVAFPLYLFLAAKIASEVRAEPDKRGSRVRKWLTYITLFVAAAFIIGDLVTLVYQFLSGELTIRIGLKILTVAVISGAIFLYYLGVSARDESEA